MALVMGYSRRALQMTVVCLLLATTTHATPPPSNPTDPRRCDPNNKDIKADVARPATAKLYLYAWAGVEGEKAHDFVATIDLSPGSPCFGQVISEAEVPTSGNEPHHVGLNINNTVLGVGGFNSWRKQQPSLYFFDVATNPAHPKYIKSISPTKGAIADDFVRLPTGGFLVSLMGSKDGGSPGRVAEVSADLQLLAEHPKSGNNTKDFNPHGLALSAPAVGRFVTLDYVEYRTTFKPYTKPLYRTTARIWNTATREIIKVIDLGPQAKGLMTARYIPNGKGQFLITAGRGVLYLLDVVAETAKPIYDSGVGPGHCVMTVPFNNATRVVASLYDTSQIQLLDMSNLDKIKLLQTLKLPKSAGPHATVLAADNRTIAISTYYVQHPKGLGYTEPFTNVNERAIRLYKIAEDGNSFAPHPVVSFIDFKSLFPHRGVVRPHGMAFRPVAAKN